MRSTNTYHKRPHFKHSRSINHTNYKTSHCVYCSAPRKIERSSAAAWKMFAPVIVCKKTHLISSKKIKFVRSVRSWSYALHSWQGNRPLYSRIQCLFSRFDNEDWIWKYKTTRLSKARCESWFWHLRSPILEPNGISSLDSPLERPSFRGGNAEKGRSKLSECDRAFNWRRATVRHEGPRGPRGLGLGLGFCAVGTRQFHRLWSILRQKFGMWHRLSRYDFRGKFWFI